MYFTFFKDFSRILLWSPPTIAGHLCQDIYVKGVTSYFKVSFQLWKGHIPLWQWGRGVGRGFTESEEEGEVEEELDTKRGEERQRKMQARGVKEGRAELWDPKSSDTYDHLAWFNLPIIHIPVWHTHKAPLYTSGSDSYPHYYRGYRQRRHTIELHAVSHSHLFSLHRHTHTHTH